jgi:hypothetical protein
VRLEGSGKFKKFTELIGTRTRDLLIYSIVPEPLLHEMFALLAYMLIIIIIDVGEDHA